jgi:hypothetical protein
MTQSNIKRNKLKNMTIDEVSFVDKGANPGAYVLLYKRDNMENLETNAENFDKSAFSAALSASEVQGEIWKLTSILGDAINQILESGTDEARDEIVDSIVAFSEELKKRITEALAAKSSEIDRVKEDLSELNKRYDLISNLDDKGAEYFMSLDDNDKESLLKSENPLEEIKKRLEKDEIIEYNGEKISKIKVGDVSFALIQKLAQDKADADRKLQEEIDKRLESENIQKAKEMLADYSINDDEALSVYKVYSKLNDEEKSSFNKIFQAGSAALKGFQVQKSLPTSEPVELTDVEKVNQIIKAKYKGKE